MVNYMNKSNRHNILIYFDFIAALLFPVIAVFRVREYYQWLIFNSNFSYCDRIIIAKCIS